MHDWVEEANLKGYRLCGPSCVTSGKGSEDQGQGWGRAAQGTEDSVDCIESSCS